MANQMRKAKTWQSTVVNGVTTIQRFERPRVFAANINRPPLGDFRSAPAAASAAQEAAFAAKARTAAMALGLGAVAGGLAMRLWAQQFITRPNYRPNGTGGWEVFARSTSRVDPNFPGTSGIFVTTPRVWTNLGNSWVNYRGIYPWTPAIPTGPTTQDILLADVIPPRTGTATNGWSNDFAFVIPAQVLPRIVPSDVPAPLELPAPDALPSANPRGSQDPLPDRGVAIPSVRRPSPISISASGRLWRNPPFRDLGRERKLAGKAGAAVIALMQGTEDGGDALQLWAVAYQAWRVEQFKDGRFTPSWGQASWSLRAHALARALSGDADAGTLAKGVASWWVWETVVGRLTPTARHLGDRHIPGNLRLYNTQGA